MKNFILFGFVFVLTAQVFAQRTPSASKDRNVEKVASTCQGVPFNERVRISITRFSVSNRNAQAQFGEEIATILSNALVGTNCFQVLSSVKNRADWEEETGYGAAGNTAQGSSPQTGQQLGPQLVVTGEITEYQDEFTGIGPAGVQRAQIGFVLQIVDPNTRLIIYSKSFDKRKNKPGAQGGIRLFGQTIVGANLKTQAMADILEEALMEASSTLVDEKDNILASLGGKVNNAPIAAKVYNASNCAALKSGAPSVMVIIPEVHISRPAPDPAGETEIIKKLIAAGFRVVDPSVYATIRDNERINAALKDASQAASIGAEFGADIIIIGEAFSESAGRSSNMFSCRARVEARAVSTATGTVLGADGKHAGGTDITELTAAKVALKNAGGQMADYFLQAFCEQSLQIGGASKALTINVSNATFAALSKIETTLKNVSGVRDVKKSLTGNKGNLTVQYTGAVDTIADALSTKTGLNLEITEFSDQKIGVLIK